MWNLYPSFFTFQVILTKLFNLLEVQFFISKIRTIIVIHFGELK